VRRQQFHQLRLAAQTAGEHGLPARVVAQLKSFMQPPGASSTGAAHKAMGMIYQKLLAHASALSYLDGFRVMAFLLFFTIPFVWIMKKPVYHSETAPVGDGGGVNRGPRAGG